MKSEWLNWTPTKPSAEEAESSDVGGFSRDGTAKTAKTLDSPAFGCFGSVIPGKSFNIWTAEGPATTIDVPCTCSEKPYPHFHHRDGSGPGSGRGPREWRKAQPVKMSWDDLKKLVTESEPIRRIDMHVQQHPRASAPRHDFAGTIQTTGSRLPNRYVLYGREGIGKTSLAAQMPSPLFLQMKGETGLETLIDAGQLIKTPHLPEIATWVDLMAALNWILESGPEYKTLVIDALNGAERLCHEHVCQRDFDGDWSDKGFMGYMRGYETALADWRQFLAQLDAIRLKHKMTIMVLSHAKISTFKNPEGPDYDRFQPDVTPKTWSLTHKWADAVLFWNFEVQLGQVQENRKAGTKKGKLIGQNRILYTQNAGAYDAKNRLGLEPEIDMGDSPQEAWLALKTAIIAARKQPQPQPQREPQPTPGGVQ